MVPSATSSYADPRAHALRERYVRTFGGPEVPVPVESIAEDLLGLRIEERPLEWSGMLLTAKRTIVLNLAKSPRNDPPLRRHRFTIAHEIGHSVCHCLEGRAATLQPSHCRATDIANDVDRAIERKANIFASELLMPEAAVRAAWEEIVAQSHESDLAAVASCGRHFGLSPTAMQWRLHSFGLAQRPTRTPREMPA
jgi:hypothetical protein